MVVKDRAFDTRRAIRVIVPPLPSDLPDTPPDPPADLPSADPSPLNPFPPPSLPLSCRAVVPSTSTWGGLFPDHDEENDEENRSLAVGVVAGVVAVVVADLALVCVSSRLNRLENGVDRENLFLLTLPSPSPDPDPLLLLFITSPASDPNPIMLILLLLLLPSCS